MSKAAGSQLSLADPVDHVGVLGVVGIGHDLHEPVVSGHASAVIGRRRIGARDASRQRDLRVERKRLLDLDPMLPVVAEVVRSS